MFGRHKRTDAQPAHAEARTTEAIITPATEPVLPPPLASAAIEPVLAPPPPPAAPRPAPQAAAPAAPAPAPPSPDTDALSPADIRARTLLADSIARMELSLKSPPPPPPPASALSLLPVTTSSAAVEALADSVARTASEVARALEHVSNMCAMLGERLDADREERRVLTDAIARLGVDVPVPAAPSTVLGGTVYPAPSETEPEPEPAPAVIELDDAPVISLVDDEPEPLSGENDDSSFFAAPPPAREHDTSTLEDDGIVRSASMFASPPPARESEAMPEAPESAFASPPAARDDDIISIVEQDDDRVEPASEAPTGAGMWCRDDDQWIGGVEIADFISDNGTIRYWLRRTSDGQMLPRPFDATDLRFIRETAPSGSES